MTVLLLDNYRCWKTGSSGLDWIITSHFSERKTPAPQRPPRTGILQPKCRLPHPPKNPNGNKKWMNQATTPTVNTKKTSRMPKYPESCGTVSYFSKKKERMKERKKERKASGESLAFGGPQPAARIQRIRYRPERRKSMETRFCFLLSELTQWIEGHGVDSLLFLRSIISFQPFQISSIYSRFHLHHLPLLLSWIRFSVVTGVFPVTNQTAPFEFVTVWLAFNWRHCGPRRCHRHRRLRLRHGRHRHPFSLPFSFSNSFRLLFLYCCCCFFCVMYIYINIYIHFFYLLVTSRWDALLFLRRLLLLFFFFQVSFV